MTEAPDPVSDLVAALPEHIGGRIQDFIRAPGGLSSQHTDETGWPGADITRDRLAREASCLCCAEMIARWVCNLPADATPDDHLHVLERLVRATLPPSSYVWPLVVLDRIALLKASALDLVRTPKLESVLSPRSLEWRASVRAYVTVQDLGNAVAYLACVLHIELANASEMSEMSKVQEALAVGAAGGGYLPWRKHSAIRHVVRSNVAAA